MLVSAQKIWLRVGQKSGPVTHLVFFFLIFLFVAFLGLCATECLQYLTRHCNNNIKTTLHTVNIAKRFACGSRLHKGVIL